MFVKKNGKKVFVGTPNQTLRVGTGQVIGGARKKRVFVGMSGGVDSSVAAALLKKQGYDVVGVHLKCFNVDGCAERDAEDARRAAEHLDIPFYTFGYEKEYKQRVVDYMVAGYKKGITPNPDVMCNKEIKFGLFFDKAMELGADYVATGHYVRLRRTSSSKQQVVSSKGKKSTDRLLPTTDYQLLTARDTNKDQSYFLWAIKPEHLARCLFPIGDYKKSQVRKLAEEFGLHNALKKDSQGICFLGQVDLPEFLKKYIKPKKGNIVLLPGASRLPAKASATVGGLQIIGSHKGAHMFTVGQRHGIGVGGTEKPLYVAEKDVKKNLVMVAEGEDHPALYRKEVELTDVNLFNPLLLTTSYSLPVLARVRYRQPVSLAKLVIGKKLASYKLIFAKPQKFVAAGQSAVFYDAKGVMLGGGVII